MIDSQLPDALKHTWYCCCYQVGTEGRGVWSGLVSTTSITRQRWTWSLLTLLLVTVRCALYTITTALTPAGWTGYRCTFSSVTYLFHHHSSCHHEHDTYDIWAWGRGTFSWTQTLSTFIATSADFFLPV